MDNIFILVDRVVKIKNILNKYGEENFYISFSGGKDSTVLSWLINEYNIEICNIYNPPYNFTRTSCKGCPFARNLQKELDTLEKYFPAERKQCEYIWKPVYNEYRRIGYRLNKGGITC